VTFSPVNIAAIVAFAVGVLWLFYVYAGYPLALAALGRIRRFIPESDERISPRISVLMSARNEEKDIEWKVRETLEWDYPPERLEMLVASDASTDRTDAILSSIADSRLRWLRLERRTGKNGALNQLAQLATGDFLFFTDANSHIAADGLKKIVRHFADARVGCVTGWERTMTDDAAEHAGASGGGAYLRYESMINRLESQLGSVLVCDGSIFCIRRELFSAVQPDLANDLELPLRIGSAGYKLLYEPEVCSMEKATDSPLQEFTRRRRICGQGLLGMWRLRACLHGMRLWQFVSRKLLRWFSLVALAFIAAGTVMLSTSPEFRALLVLQLLFSTMATFGWLQAWRKQPVSRVFALPFYFMLANVAAFTGVLETCFGRRFATWEIPSLSRGTVVSAAAIKQQ
jgi:cellulose synthase/poly-beta-1,6-N-acetylglucosamine synthase-like glycosyltransferase